MLILQSLCNGESISKAKIAGWVCASFWAVLFSAVLMVVPQTSWAENDVETDNLNPSAIKQACYDLVMDYAFYRDRYDADEVANLFTRDAVFTLQGKTYSGRTAIYQRIQNGKGGMVTRHLMSVVRIFVEDASNATGISYATIYGASPKSTTSSSTASSPTPAIAPLRVDGFLAVGEYHDKFVKTADGWKISERKFVPVFQQN